MVSSLYDRVVVNDYFDDFSDDILDLPIALAHGLEHWHYGPLEHFSLVHAPTHLKELLLIYPHYSIFLIGRDTTAMVMGSDTSSHTAK